jgi:hypothetical protein
VAPDIRRKGKVRAANSAAWLRGLCRALTREVGGAKKRLGLGLAKIEFVRAIRVIVIALGWIIALFMAGTAIALAREYGFEGVGWGWTAFLFTPLILMLAGMLWTWRHRR